MASIHRSLSDARTDGCQLEKKSQMEALRVGGSEYDGAQNDGAKVAEENSTDTGDLRAAVEHESSEHEARTKTGTG